MKLTPEEELLDRHRLFLKWLREKKVNFPILANIYIGYLEELREEQQNIIAGLSVPAGMFVDGNKLSKKQMSFVKAKGAYFLIKSKLYNETAWEDELKKYLKKSGYKKEDLDR